MCGIFGYIGYKNGVDIVISGIKKLEYRGYDSSGIAGVKAGELISCKAIGKVSELEKKINKNDFTLGMAIAHTRWATHGVPSEVNAHPHYNNDRSLAVIHNGIIENYEYLRQMLKEKGCKFVSDTDTEVIAHLITSFYDKDLLKAVQDALPLLQGSYAIAVVHKEHSDCIITAAKESPLAIGIGNGETFIASDTSAFLVHTREVCFLHDGEVAVVKRDSVEIFDETSEQIIKETEILSMDYEAVCKDGYEHFMLKEIHEQPQTIRNVLLSRFIESYGNVSFDEMSFSMEELVDVQRIVILACGTSWHAGYIAAYMLEDIARIPTQVETSSEFRYKNPIIQDNTLVIAISQSGETADTLAAMRECKAKGAKIMSICNVQGSAIARESHCCLFLRAGTEVGVASTKAFTSQLVVLTLITVMLGRMRNMGQQQGMQFIHALQQLPLQVERVLSQADSIRQIAKKYAKYDHFFFIGRRYMYPTALEGALKLKEISYINANAYPAGEMKHGPIALINKDCPTVVFCADRFVYDKVLSNIMEIKSRSGYVIAIAEEGMDEVGRIADDVIWIPKTVDELAAIPSTVASQLLAYYIAYERGTEIDQPRNLAKSVTVE